MSYGCYNREPYARSMLVQHGWHPDGTLKEVYMPLRMSPDCQYQRDDKYADPQCVGCKHKEIKDGNT